MVQESKEKPKQILYEDSNTSRGEDANRYASLNLMDRPHSNYFAMLFLVSLTRVRPPKPIVDIGEKKHHPYILEFDVPKTHMRTPPSKTKELNC